MHYQHYSTPIEIGKSQNISPILNTIKFLYKKDSVCCEFGSGDVSTPFLINQGYEVHCFEENKDYLNRYAKATYNYTPIARGWFEKTQLEIKIPHNTDFFLIDAPFDIGHRANLHKNYFIFSPFKAPIFINCKYDIDLWAAKKLAHNLKRPIIVADIDDCKFCIIGLGFWKSFKLKFFKNK